MNVRGNRVEGRLMMEIGLKSRYFNGVPGHLFGHLGSRPVAGTGREFISKARAKMHAVPEAV